ncbi:hypothetical protein GGR52DRAFT_529538 [Hypoxylon sp. FL1284]|nr:hypothetical protein GGR52DRAFT_566749 [Hypoxylon sp. FL1284]KAI0180048.1 hypothetical protein GGR52DRAFT_529538 [Hypoxylon sp. FL1284]
MKGSRPICLLCHHRLVTSGALRSSQRQSHSVLSSTTTAAHRQSEQRARWFGTKRKALFCKVPEKGDSAGIDALFDQVVHHQTATQDALPNTSPANPNLELTLVQAIGKLEHMVRKGGSLIDSYAFLKTDVYPMLEAPDITIPRVFYMTVSTLLEKLVAAKKKAIRSDTLPTVADIFRVYVDIGEMIPRRWAILVGELVKSILEMEPSTKEQHLDAADGKDSVRDAMLSDLVESWKVLSLPRDMPVAPDDEVTDDFCFPRANPAWLKRFSDKGNFPAALSTFFPQYPPFQLGAPVAVLAIATYALLIDTQRSSPIVRLSAARFIAKMEYLITFVRYPDTNLRSEVSHYFPFLESYIMDWWPIIKKQLKHRFESTDVPTTRTQPREPSSSTNSGGINKGSIGERLQRAYVTTRNYGDVDRLWGEFLGSTTGNIHPDRIAELRNESYLFDSFIHARMATNQPNKAIEALRVMRQVGLRPTVKTWNSMLDGCKKSRNVNAIKNVWAKIAGSGMELDMRIWTTRVSALVESGDVEGGLQALQEMMKLWQKSSKDERIKAVKPTIEPVNAALVGLTRQNHTVVAESLLDWARRHGLQPDVFTFNTLLRLFVRHKRDTDVRRLFATMKRSKVDADEATFTIVLDEAFSTILPEDTERQANMVMRVVEHMQAAGLEVNLQTYGKMIYNLLRMGDGAVKAVKAVLAHILAQGLELSPHIYTMIVEHYFARQPPDLEAVGALLKRHRLLDREDMDATFYDRVVRGYAEAGRPASALDIYWRLSAAGLPVILSTQLELLTALFRDGAVDDATRLVANTKRMFEESHRAADSVDDAGFWGHPFWSFAERHSLYERNGSGAASGAATTPTATASAKSGSP